VYSESTVQRLAGPGIPVMTATSYVVAGRRSRTKTAAICYIRDMLSTASRREKSDRRSTGRSVHRSSVN